jgi:cytochrome c biogenesis protein CcdA
MIRNALFVTAVIFLALGIALLGECRFLIPYRTLIVRKYGTTILIFLAALFLNVFTGVYLARRKLFLKDTGRKLAHIDKQLRRGESITDELARYLED